MLRHFRLQGAHDVVRYAFTDDLWNSLAPAVKHAKRYKCGKPPVLSDCMFFEALLYWARTGLPWRDLPEVFGAWDAVYNRFRRWVASGSLKTLFELLTANPSFAEVRRVFIDSTIIRAHPHAAGARRRHKKIGPETSARAQGLGRSRGGFTSKIVVTATDENTAVAVNVIPGQANDAPQLAPMLKASWQRLRVIDEMVGDKGFDGDAQRFACLARGVFPNIPSRKNRIDPWPYDPEGYKERNRIERLFSKLKQYRRVATRYEKLKQTFQGVIHLSLGFIRFKHRIRTSIVNTT
jgi:transposase